jgi:mannose-6-phosphate isomerase-like protein (cupin superfamily)
MNHNSDGKVIKKEAYAHALEPAVIPVPGNKTIEEFLGLLNSGHSQVSVAHMIAPPGWGEPAQTPGFDEVTIVISGKMRAEIGGDSIDIGPGQPFMAHKGHKVRYSNPFTEPAEYWAICLPAFSMETVNREEEPEKPNL